MSLPRRTSVLILLTLTHAGSCRDYSCYDTATCPLLADAGSDVGPNQSGGESVDERDSALDASAGGVDAREPSGTSGRPEATGTEGGHTVSDATTDSEGVSTSDGVDRTTDALRTTDDVATSSFAVDSATGDQTESSAKTSPSSAAATSAGGSSTEGEDTPPVPPEPILITSGPGAYWQVGEVADGAGPAHIVVSAGQELQEWLGFGGTFSERGWDALSRLTPGDRSRAMKLLFDSVEGAGFTYGEVPIGANEYAMDRYTLNDHADDYGMGHFSIERDQERLIPFIKAAQSVNPAIKFFATPWTPPPWLKTNNSYDRGSMKSDVESLAAHALYLARFVQDYAEEGIPIYAVYPQNEPGYEMDYPSCLWSSATMVSYLRDHLGPTFEALGIEAQIWLGTLSNTAVDHTLGTAVLSDGGAATYVEGVGLQWAMISHLDAYRDSGRPVVQTQHKAGNYPWLAGTFNSDYAPNDHAYGVESWTLLRDWISSGVNGYIAWNMVLDTVGASLDVVRIWPQNSLLTVDFETGALGVTPAYYVFRHLAQFVEPGAFRLDVQGGDAVAFKNPDGSVVTISFNPSDQAETTTLSALGKTVQFTIPASGWATVKLVQ